MLYAQIAPHAALPFSSDELTYTVPAALFAELHIGQLVRIRVRGRATWGVVTKFTRRVPRGVAKLAAIDQVTPISIRPEALALARAIRATTLQPLGNCIATMLPPVMKRFPAQPIVKQSTSNKRPTEPSTINIVGAVSERFHEYESLASRSIRAGRSMVVVFSHTALVDAFLDSCRLPALRWNTDVKTSQRWATWLAAQQSPQLIVGLRSAASAPVASLGAIIIDEPTARGHKDDQAPYLTSVRMAQLRQSIEGGHVILGSSAPVLEQMSQRLVPSRSTPISLVPSDPNRRNVLQAASEAWLTNHWRPEERLLVLVDRVGGGTIRCQTCHTAVACPTCGRGVVRHGSGLICRVCDWRGPSPETCTVCHGTSFTTIAFGAEAIATQLQALTQQPVAIVDRYHTDWPSGDAPIIVGTEAVVPYLPSYRPTVSLILGLDSARQAPAYDANERIIRLVTTISGSTTKAVAIETAQLGDPWVTALAQRQEGSLLKAELTDRTRFGYPPDTTLVAVRAPVGTLTSSEIPTKLFAQGFATIGPVMDKTGRTERLIVKLTARQSIRSFISRLATVPLPRGVSVELDPLLHELD